MLLVAHWLRYAVTVKVPAGSPPMLNAPSGWTVMTSDVTSPPVTTTLAPVAGVVSGR